MIKTLDTYESKVSLATLENERSSFCGTPRESTKRKNDLESEEIHFDGEEAEMFKLNESISIFRGEVREERYSWFFLKEEKQMSPKTECWNWIECKETELIESAYYEYFKSFSEEKTKDFLNYATYTSSENEFDFINSLMLSLDNKSIHYKLGRFKGNPNQIKNLPNYLLENNFKWYFSNNENYWTPYNIEINLKIETRFKNFYLNKGIGKYLVQGYELDFKKFIEKCIMDGKIKKIARFNKCPINIIRKDYFNNEIKLEMYPVNPSIKESMTHLRKQCFLLFKNIFPSKFYSKTQKFGFYLKSKSNSIILHLASGWSFDDNDEVEDKYSTSVLIEKLRLDGYKLICEIDKDQDKSSNFFNLNKFPIKMMRSLFKTRWYQRFDEGNKYLWLQLGCQANSEIESIYKKKFLLLSDFDDIEIEDLDIVVNFRNNKILKDGKVSSIMRLNMKNGYPDKVSIINVAEEVYDKVNSKNERLKIENQLVLYANQFGPININELIYEIRKEIKTEGYKLGSDESVQVYDKLYLQTMNNSNFVENIINLYSEEGFVYKRINQLLRDKDYEKLWKMKYFYFSLLYCIEQNQDINLVNTVFRGLSLTPEQKSFCRALKQGDLVVVNEFLSTNQDRELANYYSKNGPGSYIFEITVPDIGSSNLNLENLSRFACEREVLIPSGSILKFEEKIEEADYTVLKLNLVVNNYQLYCDFLSLHLNNVDLTMIKFNIHELNYLFNSLQKNIHIKQICLKVYQDNLIPYFADKIAINETLQHITVIRDGLTISNKYIGFNHHMKGSINLKNFSKKEFSLFILRFLKKAKIWYLSLPNFYEESLIFLGKCLANKDELKKLELSFDSMEVYDNFKYLVGAISINTTLKELNLTNLYLTHQGVINIGKMIVENYSLEKIMFSIDISVELEEIARKIRQNRFLKEICISFSSKNLVNKRTIKYDGRELKYRKITLINVYNSKFTSVLSQILMENMDIMHLNLSNNDLNRKYSKLLIEIINDCVNLSSIDLSNNLLCDNAIKEILNDIYQYKELKEVNLENNYLTSIGHEVIKEFPQFHFRLNYNYISGLPYQREKTDEYKDNHCMKNLYDHTSYIYSLIELPNGIFASGSYDTTIKLWDANDNFRCIETLEGHDDGVYSLLLLAEGKLASGSGDHSIRIWDTSVNYECIKILKGHYETVYSLLHIGNGQIASGSRDTKIKIWDTCGSFNCIMTLEGHSEAVLCLLFSPLGKIISGSYDKTIRVWDPKMNFNCTNILHGHEEGVYSLVSLNDGKIISGSKDTTIKIWDTFNNYQCVHTILAHTDYVYSLVILSDGKLASGSGDATIKIWDQDRNFKNIETIEGHTDAVMCLSVISEGKLISGSYDATIRVWNPKKNFQNFQTLKGHLHYVYCLKQLSDGRIASGSGDNLIKLWDPNYNFNCVQTLKGHTLSVYCIVQLYNGDIASGSRDKTIKIWSAQNNFSCSHSIIGHEEAVTCLVILQNGQLASGSYDTFIKIWDPSGENKICQVLEGHRDAVLTFLLISNGYLFSGSGDRTIKIWNTNSNYNCINTLQGHSDAIFSLVLLSDGKLASGSYDKTIRIWDCTKDYRCIKILEGHSNFVLTLLVLNDGHLASGSGDKSIKIWDSNYSYKCVQTLHGHSENIYSLIELWDGSIASGSGDKCIKIWFK
jgi:WD40 repeat protein